MVIPSNCPNHNTTSVSRYRRSHSTYIVFVCVCMCVWLHTVCVHIIHRMVLPLLLVIHITSWLRLKKLWGNWGLQNITLNGSHSHKFGMDSLSLRAYGMHFSLYISVLFYFCEEQKSVHSCTDSKYFSVFGYNFQISNHRPFSRVLSYKKYFTYYAGLCLQYVF